MTATSDAAPHQGDSRDTSAARLDPFTAELADYAYPRHMHDTWVVALGRGAAYALECAGARHVVPRGALVVIPPGQVHDGHSAGRGVVHYRGVYPSAALMARLAGVAGAPQAAPPRGPRFDRCVIEDRTLARAFELAHRRLQRDPAGSDGSAPMLDVLARLIAAHARATAGAPAPSTGARTAIRRAKAYIDGRLGEPIPLAALAEIARLSPFHLVREFRRTFGMPPHAYVVNARVELARRMLGEGVPIAQAAAHCGFADQAHLTRAFRRIMRVTPGAWAKSTARSFKTD